MFPATLPGLVQAQSPSPFVSMKPVSLTRRDVDRHFPAPLVRRGIALVREGRVQQLRWSRENNRYSAVVDDPDPDTSRVEASLLNGSAGVRIYGQCTCAAGTNCEHVAAVLLAALADGMVAEPAAGAAPRLPAPRADNGAAGGPAVLPAEWSQWIHEASAVLGAPAGGSTAAANAHRLLYLVDAAPAPQKPGVRLRLVTARVKRDGQFGSVYPWRGVRAALFAPPPFVSPEDQRILRRLLGEANPVYESEFALRGEAGAEVLPLILATGRCHAGDGKGPALAQGEPRAASARWVVDEDGEQRLRWQADEPIGEVLVLSPPWYLDEATGRCGPIDSGLEPRLAYLLSTVPPVAADHAGAARALLENRLVDAPVPMPAVSRELDVNEVVPVPCLRLTTVDPRSRGFRSGGGKANVANLRFEYAGMRVGPKDPGIVREYRNGVLRRIHRHGAAEKRFHEVLRAEGLERISSSDPVLAPDYTNDYRFGYPEDCVRFVCERVPALREAGWIVEYDETFDYRPVDAGQWQAEVREEGRDWFDLSLGVEVEGKRVDLLPILVAVLKERPDLATETGPGYDDNEQVPVRLDDGRILPIPLRRVRPLLRVLDELLDGMPGGSLRLARLDAQRLSLLDESGDIAWQGGEAVRELGGRLAHFREIKAVPAPKTLRAQLRPYQLEGLAWLQFLREYDLGGILADDMGLGKTLQAIAHILVEKAARRLTQPALIIAPTSVVPNWRNELARFAPSLKVLVSHGLKRTRASSRLAEHDVVITSYPLLSRDRTMLQSQPFHLVILDEAQLIKNAQTQAANVVRTLDARHRLCLTGTPLENHLGELWSLFHFLMPGFLGDATSFRRVYRTPIEKHGNVQRRDSLERRIRPFLLRRTKEAVASELPAKTEIVQTVELSGDQREFYETVRAAMDERVQRELENRGAAQSQIIVLDALLKLRQVCCDPRLVKMETAQPVVESAKLGALMEMLEALLSEGRKVLLFSQFTEMLELIEERLRKAGMQWVKLTGATRDREAPIRTFQAGEVPLFLISLKAGGTGLNLTAADTVIHYDPWWNPAVERQATDRAHRIGQDKPVFVYKLIVAGSVEEKIAKLQADKAALAEAILGEPGRASRTLTAEDIAALFEPLR